jgi:REP element-mobilizing transposase RayT
MILSNTDIHHRRSIRLKGYGYSQAGLYFVTVCTHNRLCLFGEIKNGEMVLNDPGIIIDKWWNELKHKYKNIELHEQIIMPNHFHGIVQITNDPLPVGADLRVCPVPTGTEKSGEHIGSPLHTMIQWFKTMTTNEYIRGVNNNGWPRFNKKLWQRNYYEHIIRDEKSCHQIAEYIQTNPLKWQNDKYYV